MHFGMAVIFMFYEYVDHLWGDLGLFSVAREHLSAATAYLCDLC